MTPIIRSNMTILSKTIFYIYSTIWHWFKYLRFNAVKTFYVKKYNR